MIKELTVREESLLHESVVTRIRTVEKLIYGWEQYPDEHTPKLIEIYSKDLADLKEIEKKLLVWN